MRKSRGCLGMASSRPKVLSDPAIRNRVLTVIALLATVIFLANVETWFNTYVGRILKTGAIYAISVLSLNLINGCTGLLSLGNAGFMAIGAYTASILSMSPSAKEAVFFVVPIEPVLLNIQIPFYAAAMCGGLLAAFAAFLIGFPVLRLKGDYLSMATLGFSEIIRVLIINAPSITNGSLGINRIPNFASMWVVFGTLAVVAVFLLLLMDSSYGRAFKAIREDQIAAEAMGIYLFRHKMYSFVISGFLAGISGALLASITGAIEPTTFRYTFVYQFLLMMVLGGQGSISGSIIGAMLVAAALEWLRFMDEPINFGFFRYPGYPGMRMVLFAVILIGIVLFWSRGIFGDKELSWRWVSERLANARARLSRPRKAGVA